MPTVTVKLYSVFYKIVLRHRLQSLLHSSTDTCDPFGVTSRPEESVAAANPTFSSSSDGVATKDIHIDPLTSLSIRIFLPSSSLPPPKGSTKPPAHPSTGSSRNVRSTVSDPESDGVEDRGAPRQKGFHRRNSYGGSGSVENGSNVGGLARRSSFGSAMEVAEGTYKGYLPTVESLRRIGNSQSSRKLPVILQFHGGGFVAGSADSVANDFFCRRIARLCDAIVIAVGYRLAPESRFPAAFEDGLKVLNWLGKQANLMECSKSMGSGKKAGGGGGNGGGGETRRSEMHRHIIDTFGASMVEPWLAAHADPSRCVLLGVSCGANIANFVAQKAVEAGKLLDPVKVVAQILLYPFFIGCAPTQSEIKLANSYFYDKSLCTLAWKLFLPEEEFSLDHPAANPLIHRQGPPLKCMPPTLTVVAEHDWMRDRAIAYSEELRKVNVDAPVLEYKDAVHEFATLDIMLKTPQAQACAEDIAIWVKKYISTRGHEFSY